MISNKQLMLAIGVSGWALLSAMGKSRKQSRRDAKKSHKQEVNTWEGEGGNLPPGAPTPSKPGNVVGNSALMN